MLVSSLSIYRRRPRGNLRRCLSGFCLKHDEATFQKNVIKWFNLQYPHLEGLLVGYVAGLNLSINTRTRMKAMGLRAGFPDLMLLVPKRLPNNDPMATIAESVWSDKHIHGLFIELKTPKGRLSPKQKAYHDKLRSQDYTVIVCNEFVDVVAEIGEYLKNSHPWQRA